MQSLCLSLLLSVVGAQIQLVKRADNTQPFGNNKIVNFSSAYLGEQSSAPCSHRDLGFTGKINGKWYAVYGDTLFCANGVTDPHLDDGQFHGMVRDAVASLSVDGLSATFLQLDGSGHPKQFVPFNSAWGETNLYGFGGTSLCETNAASSQGAIYYLVNANDAGLKGAGVGRVQVQNGIPNVVQRYGTNGWWWNANTSAHYGDIAAYKDDNSGYIYILGNPPNSVTTFPDNLYTYMARVTAANAFNLASYEYWWGRTAGWKSDLLTTFNSETAVMWGVGQGQFHWNNFYNCYMFIHLSGNNVNIRTADSAQGPWSADITVYTDNPASGEQVYAGVAHPYVDGSGKTLTISFTRANTIRVIKVTFS
ncbi:hypothetical protein BT69DRAFT_1244487 [Atractiella rhizophila]|nr:hypothetical protein BT69DRAFT_1244487 [Atractiella rhizophila]